MTTGVELLTMFRSKEWELVDYLGDDTSGELYDLLRDPGESRNLYSFPEYREKREELKGVLLNWRIRSDNATADWAKSWR